MLAVPNENSIPVKKGEVKQPRRAHHSVCRSVIGLACRENGNVSVSRGNCVGSIYVKDGQGLRRPVVRSGDAARRMKAQWTHLALHVQSVEASIAFYSHYANFRVIDRHFDASSTGVEVVWLSDRSANDELIFVMVLQEGIPHNLPGAKPQLPLGPISHLGFALASREEVDAVAAEAKRA